MFPRCRHQSFGALYLTLVSLAVAPRYVTLRLLAVTLHTDRKQLLVRLIAWIANRRLNSIYVLPQTVSYSGLARSKRKTTVRCLSVCLSVARVVIILKI